MSPAEREKNDRKLLMSVAALVAGGALVIVVLANLARDSAEVDPAATVAKSERIASTARSAAVPAAFERKVEPVAPVPTAVVPEPLFDIDPDEDFVARGLESYEEREFDRAAAYFLAEADARPQRAWTHYMIGLSLWKAGRADEAVVAMEEAARLDPDAVRTFVNLSRIHNDRGEFDEALEAARAGLEIDTDDPSASFLEGRSLMNLGRLDEAVDSLERSLAIDPDNGYAQNMLGLVFIEQGLPSYAVAPLRRASELVPDVAYVHNNLGMALERSGERYEAVAAYRRAVECDAGYARGAANLARLEPALGPLPIEDPEEFVAALDLPDVVEAVVISETVDVADGESTP